MVVTWRIAARLFGVVLMMAGAGAARAQDDRPLSPAQIALFESNHLKEISRPVVLDYTFQHRGGKGDFDDKVSADIRAVRPDGKKDVWIDFLTGEHKVNYPPVMDFSGNPLLMFFLEHDVVQMGEATGGASQYFRNRIREAFVDRAEIHPTEITVDGKKANATEIDLAPFRNDPNLQRFPAFSDKVYRFVLSDAVPGAIYRISTSVPNPSASPGLFEESMTYAGEHAEKQ